MMLVTPEIKRTLELQKYSQGRVNVPNNHPLMATELERLKAATEVLGIDFEATNYTYRVVVKDNTPQVYSAEVRKDEKGSINIYWGDVVKPLSEVPSRYADTSEDNKLYILFEGSDGTEVTLSFRANKEVGKIESSQLRKALKEFKAGKPESLAALLSEGAEFAKALTELAPAYDESLTSEEQAKTYKVIGAEKVSTPWGSRWEISVESHGKFKANTKVTGYIESLDTLPSPESPVELTVFPVTRQTKTGHPIVDVKLFSQADERIPVFTF